MRILWGGKYTFVQEEAYCAWCFVFTEIGLCGKALRGVSDRAHVTWNEGGGYASFCGKMPIVALLVEIGLCCKAHRVVYDRGLTPQSGAWSGLFLRENRCCGSFGGNCPTSIIDWFWFPIFRTNWDVRDDHKIFVFSPGTVKSMTERSQSMLKFIREQFWRKLLPYELVNPTIKIILYKAVRGVSDRVHVNQRGG